MHLAAGTSDVRGRHRSQDVRVLAMSDCDEENCAQEPAPAESGQGIWAGLRGWSPADLRTFWITVIGGLVVTLTTAILVALGLALVHFWRRSSAETQEFAFLAGGAGDVLMIYLTLWRLRDARKTRVARLVVRVIGILFAVVLLLALAGLTAGIK
jgi:hypothetical protein